MTVVVIAPPDAVLAAADIRTALDLDATTPDAVLDALAATAQSMVDGPTGTLRRAILTQTLEYRFDHWGRHWRHARHDWDPERWRAKLSGPNYWHGYPEIELPFPPLQSVTSITYVDQMGTPQTLDQATYRTIGGGEGLSRIVPVYGQTWPAAQYEPEAIKVQFIAGYTTCPGPIRQAMLMMIRNLLSVSTRDAFLRTDTVDNVGSQSFDTSAAAGQAMNGVVEALLAPFRVAAL